MLKQRVITALVLGAVVVGALVFLPGTTLWLVLAPLAALLAWEWAQFAGIRSQSGRIVVGLLTGLALLFAYPSVDPIHALWASGASYAFFLGSIIALRRRRFGSDEGWGSRALRLGTGLFVILTAMIALGQIYQLDAGSYWLLTLLLLIWSADIGAYAAGRRFGKRKLAVHVSPGKSWEGVYGGMAAVALVALCLGLAWSLGAHQIIGLVLLALVTAAISIIGDLFASLMKRQVGLKDSSSLLPGHGGLVDRLDSTLAAAPVFYLGLWLLLG